jgi:hypothetical protein
MEDMPKSAEKWYKIWISAFPETWHPLDLERFYMFVSVLLKNSKKIRSTSWLEKNLREDCPRLSSDDIEKYCYIFEHLKNFKRVWKSQQAYLILTEERKKYIESLRAKFLKK